jgi:hypothetical protein
MCATPWAGEGTQAGYIRNQAIDKSLTCTRHRFGTHTTLDKGLQSRPCEAQVEPRGLPQPHHTLQPRTQWLITGFVCQWCVCAPTPRLSTTGRGHHTCGPASAARQYKMNGYLASPRISSARKPVGQAGNLQEP